MNNRDIHLIEVILRHYDDIMIAVKEVDTFELFITNKYVNKAIKLDLLQIGEDVNQLSEEAKLQLEKNDLRGVIDMRNQVAHGYSSLREITIWNTIMNDLPRLIKQIKSIK